MTASLLVPLSESEQRMYQAVQHLTQDGWPVSVRELTRHLGYASTSTPHGLLCRLEAMGLVEQRRRAGFRPVQETL